MTGPEDTFAEPGPAPAARTTPSGLPPLPPPPDVARGRGRAWPVIRRAILIPEGLAAVVLAAAAARYERFDYLWAALAAGVIPLAYAVAGVVRSRGWGRVLRLVSALVMAVALAGSGFLVVRSCANRLGAEADLAGCDFHDTVLISRDLHGADLSDADLSGADLMRANLSGADLSRADLSGATISLADLSGADLTGADLTGVRISSANLDGATLARADLAELNLSGQDLAGVDLTEANLTSANLTDTDLRDAILDRAVLERVRLVGTDLTSASLRGTILRGATIDRTILDEAELEGLVLDGADLQRSSLIGATGLDEAVLARALGVKPGQLGRGLSAHRMRLERRGDVLGTLGAACGGAPVDEAASRGAGPFHAMAVVGETGRSIPLGDKALSRGWEPMAVRFGELVTCVAPEEEVTVETCRYFIEGSGAEGPATRRVRYTRHVRVVEARSGVTIFDQVYEGSFPESCPAEKRAPEGAPDDVLGGSRIDFAAIEADLRGFVWT